MSVSIGALPSPEPAELITVLLKSPDGKTQSIKVPPQLKISEVWSLLTVKSTVPRSRQRLVFHGKTLLPDTTLADSSITNDSTIHLIVPPSGGPKKQRCVFKDCRDGAQRIVGDCGFCRGHFCGKHRLLEDHKCDGLEDCKKESRDANASKLISERTTVIKGI